MMIVLVIWLYVSGAFITWALFDTELSRVFRVLMIACWYVVIPLGIIQELIEKKGKGL